MTPDMTTLTLETYKALTDLHTMRLSPMWINFNGKGVSALKQTSPPVEQGLNGGNAVSLQVFAFACFLTGREMGSFPDAHSSYIRN